VIALLIGLMGPAQASPPAIYMVLVDRFSNGDPSNDGDVDPDDPRAFHGGDLAGLTAKLDHIQSLGFDQVWLSPIAKMRTRPIGTHGAFHGYWVEDGRTLEPRFGTPESLGDLRAALQARKMVPVLDMVTNHVAPDAPLTKQHPEWFHGAGDISDWSDPDERITHDVHGLPDLAQERPDVQAYLIEEARRWRADDHPIRLDAVRHLPPAFVQAYTAALATPEAPAVVYGEIFEGNPVALADEARRYGLVHTFDFPLHYALVDVFCRDGDARQLATVLSADAAYAAGHTHLTFLDNHDLPRIRTACGGDEDRVAQAMDFMLALRGIPVVTYGTEAGLEGSTETQARSDMNFSRSAPVAEVIRRGLARRRDHPGLMTAPTVVGQATQESLTLFRPGEREQMVIRFSREHGVSVTPHAGPDLRVPTKPAVLSLILPEVALAPGETLWLSGSSRALGGWDPAQAQGPLRPGAHTEIRIPWGGAVATKLLVKDATGGIRWAPGGNQTMVVGLETGHPETQKLRWPAP